MAVTFGCVLVDSVLDRYCEGKTIQSSLSACIGASQQLLSVLSESGTLTAGDTYSASLEVAGQWTSLHGSLKTIEYQSKTYED